jgi:hypothetical protein
MKDDVFGLNLMVICKWVIFLMLFADALPHQIFRDGFPC